MEGTFGLQFPIIPDSAAVNILILYRVLLSWDYSSRIATFRNLHLSRLLGIVKLCSVWHSHQLCMNLCFSRPMPKDYTTYCFPICWVLRISHSWFHFAFLKFLVRLSSPPTHTYLFTIWLFYDLLVPILLGPFFNWVVVFFSLAYGWFYILNTNCNYTHWKYHFLGCGLSLWNILGFFLV